jgi:hypothetical protein
MSLLAVDCDWNWLGPEIGSTGCGSPIAVVSHGSRVHDRWERMSHDRGIAVHVFVDESLRKRYLLAAACVPVSELSDTRVVMRSLLLSGQRRLHFTEESKQRRKVLLAELCRLNVRVRMYSAAGKPTPARSAALDALLADLPSAGAPPAGHRGPRPFTGPGRRSSDRSSAAHRSHRQVNGVRPHETCGGAAAVDRRRRSVDLRRRRGLAPPSGSDDRRRHQIGLERAKPRLTSSEDGTGVHFRRLMPLATSRIGRQSVRVNHPCEVSDSRPTRHPQLRTLQVAWQQHPKLGGPH